jgi:hypothetical protein
LFGDLGERASGPNPQPGSFVATSSRMLPFMSTPRQRFQPDDELLAFLKQL